jgi:polysaccharide deacetylase family protein (PEP-CTERM system associated)
MGGELAMVLRAQAADPQGLPNALTCELEDWFHILDSDRTPKFEDWVKLPLCAERNIERLLELFEATHVRATFFCLGWMAERMPHVVRKCQAAGHEIGSHGYAHLMACPSNRALFQEDIVRAKGILEDLTGIEVLGYRSPGFSVKNGNTWFFDAVSEAGYRYDASVFPARHGHGGYHGIDPGPHIIPASSGPLVEIPISTVSLLGRRFCLFGGGYLRITPLVVIRWGARRLRKDKRPLIVYVHPREIDPDHPRLALRPWRSFKCYNNLGTTYPKLKWLCEHNRFGTMVDLASRISPTCACKSPGRDAVIQPPAAIGSGTSLD